MRRVAAAAVCVALLGAALAFAPASDWLPGGERADAARCKWHRHTKRIVKHVRRHGKRRKVVRRRHWWTKSCKRSSKVPAPAPAPQPPAAPAPTAEPTPEPEPEPVANRLGVRSSEYYFVLSRPTVSAGEVTVELDNRGEDAHDLNLQREGSGAEPVLEIGETQSLQHSVATFDLPAGTYKLWCSLPGHREAGMETTLVVSE